MQRHVRCEGSYVLATTHSPAVPGKEHTHQVLLHGYIIFLDWRKDMMDQAGVSDLGKHGVTLHKPQPLCWLVTGNHLLFCS